MNVIVCKFSLSFNRPLILDLVREYEIQNLYFVGSESGCPSKKELTDLGCKLFLFDEPDLFNGLFREVAWNDLEPLDQPLLSAMASCETELMRLMEKDPQVVAGHDKSHFEKDFYEAKIAFRPQNYASFYNLTAQSYEERKRKYFRYLRYWNNFLKVNSIDLYVGAFYPHFPYEYVLYRLIQARGIPRVIASHTPIPGRWMIYKDLEKCNEELPLRMAEVMAGKFDGYQLSAQAMAELNRIQKGMLPYYMDKAFLEKEVSNYAERQAVLANEDKRRLRVPGEYQYKTSLKTRFNLFIDKIHFRIRHSSRSAYSQKHDAFYRGLISTDISTSHNFIYAPLHYQPEASNAPIGGIFANQELIIQMLTHFIPEGWLVYVKENPKQGFMHRNPEFYRDLAENKRIRLVSKDFDTFELIRKARAVATIAGTAGWEALFNKVPVLLFGYSPLMYAPGVFNIRDNEDCRKAIGKVAEGFPVDQNELMNYVKALDLTTIPSVNDYIQKQKFGYSDEQYLKVMKKAYISFLDRNFNLRKRRPDEKI